MVRGGGWGTRVGLACPVLASFWSWGQWPPNAPHLLWGQQGTRLDRSGSGSPRQSGVNRRLITGRKCSEHRGEQVVPGGTAGGSARLGSGRPLRGPDTCSPTLAGWDPASQHPC